MATERLLLAWPRSAALWEGETALEAARQSVRQFAMTAARFLPVTVLTADAETDRSAARDLEGVSAVDRHTVPYDDIWLRDTGPIWMPPSPAGQPIVGLFDGWGEKFAHAEDARLASRLVDELGLTARRFDGVLEGGGLQVSGGGVGLTTREWLDARGLTPAGLTVFGADAWVVLDYGLVDDHTDGHVDLVARFTDGGDVVACVADEDDVPQHERLKQNFEQLLQAAADGLVGGVTALPLPKDRTPVGGVRPPRSYANFVVVPGGLLVPTYNDPRDDEALATLAASFPGREVVGVDATGLVAGGGALHCCSVTLPEGVNFAHG